MTFPQGNAADLTVGRGWSPDDLLFEYLSCGDFPECASKDLRAKKTPPLLSLLSLDYFFLSGIWGRGFGIHFLLEVFSLPHKLEKRSAALFPDQS